jgi:hypothetical protein
MTGKQTIDRYEACLNFPGFYRSENGEFVKFDDHEKTVSEMQHEIDKLKLELSIANSETTKLKGDLYTCQESLSLLQWSHPDASSESLFSRVSRWLSELTGWSTRPR